MKSFKRHGLFDAYVILEIADDLYNDCKISEYSSYRDEVWEQKYLYHTYAL